MSSFKLRPALMVDSEACDQREMIMKNVYRKVAFIAGGGDLRVEFRSSRYFGIMGCEFPAFDGPNMGPRALLQANIGTAHI